MRGEEPGIDKKETIGILAPAFRRFIQAGNPTLPCAFASVDTDVSIASTTHLHFAFGAHGINPTSFSLNCNNT